MTEGRLSNEELEDVLSDVGDAWMTDSAIECGKLADKLRAHIATLQRSADEMREALRPFAAFASLLDGQGVRGTWLQFDINTVKRSQYELQPWLGTPKREFAGDVAIVSVVEEYAGANCPMTLEFGHFRAALKALPPQEPAE